MNIRLSCKLKRHLKASFTIEASVIFPIIIIVLTTIIILSLRIHDRIIVKSECMGYMYSSLYGIDNVSSGINSLSESIHKNSILENTYSNYDFSGAETSSFLPIPGFSGNILTITAKPLGSVSCFSGNSTAAFQNYDAIIKLIK